MVVLEIVCLRELFFILQYLSNVLVEDLLLDTGLGSTSEATKLLWMSVQAGLAQCDVVFVFIFKNKHTHIHIHTKKRT